MANQTALQRRIEREAEERRQQAWEERAAPTRRRAKWAIDHLLDTGQITAEQHTAAQRLHEAIVAARRPEHVTASSLVPVHPGWDLSVATEWERVTRLWSAAQSRQAARGARSWVLAAPRTTKPRMALYDRLFALPCPSWKYIRGTDGAKKVGRISALLDVLCAYWDACDRFYGPSQEIGR